MVSIGIATKGTNFSIAAPEEVSLLIRPSRGAGLDAPRFGDSVAMRDTLVAVGDTNWSRVYEGVQPSNGHTGAIHLFDIGNPTSPFRNAYVSGSDSTHSSLFGISVAMSGDLLLVGAPLQDAIGVAYLFDISDPDNPVELAKLVATDRTSWSDFGRSVAIDGTLALIGAPGTPGQTAMPGAAYLFDLSNPALPVEKAKLTAQSPANGDHFGKSVSLHSETNRVLIGSPTQSGPSSGGFAEIYDVSSLMSPSHVTSLSATADESTSNEFGTSVDLSASAALVGAPGRDDAGVGMDTGAAYLFNLSNPSSPSGVQIIASDRAAQRRLGQSVQLGAGHAVIGARGSLSGLDGVIAYHFDVSNLASPVQAGKMLPGNLRLFNQSMGVAIDRNLAVLTPVNDEESSRIPAVSLFKLFDPVIDLSHDGPFTGIPAQILPGQSFTLDSGLDVTGNVESGPFRIGIHFSSDNIITGHDPSPAFLDHDSVSPGSHPYSVDVTIPSGFRLGNYFVGSILDSGGSIAETDESNNTLSSATRLMVGTPEAILKQGEIDLVNRSIASVQRQLRSAKRKIKKAKKKRNRKLLKRLKGKERKLKSRNRTLVNRRNRLLLELDLLLQP